MDLTTKDDLGVVDSLRKSDNEEGSVNSKVKGTGSLSSKDMLFRADKIDLKSLDMQLEKHLSWVWSRNESLRPKEEWEIDLSKLDMRNLIAQGTYGSVYRGTYDNQEVAGIIISSFLLMISIVIFRLICLVELIYTFKWLHL